MVVQLILVNIGLGRLLLTWIDLNPSLDKQSYQLYNVEWNRIYIHRLQRLYRWTLGIDELISLHTLLDMWLIIHAGIRVKAY